MLHPSPGTTRSRWIFRALVLAVVTSAQASLIADTTPGTGWVTKVLKSSQARVEWDSGGSSPAAGSLGTVIDRDRLIALFRVLDSEKQSSKIQIVDLLVPGLLSKKQEVALLDLGPAEELQGRTSLLVWSDRRGGSLRVDGKKEDRVVPARVVVEAGPHEVVLNLPDGGKAGARIEAHPEEEVFLCLHDRAAGLQWTESPPPYYGSSKKPGSKPGGPQPLRWFEDRQGNRIYDSSGPVKNPVLKQSILPRFPNSLIYPGVEARVVLDAMIGSDGRVKQMETIFSPHPEFSRSAVDAVRQWIYEPATLDGNAVPVFMIITVDFYSKRSQS